MIYFMLFLCCFYTINFFILDMTYDDYLNLIFGDDDVN